ncbi:uncharacterized protein LOC102070522 [Zonotrichia albicollis]|uniref:uncharacterized protein LOC102070522 n=1 Tax=Zonotrichia albicollis TaxID=44394 RepID=UPI003D80D741
MTGLIQAPGREAPGGGRVTHSAATTRCLAVGSGCWECGPAWRVPYGPTPASPRASARGKAPLEAEAAVPAPQRCPGSKALPAGLPRRVRARPSPPEPARASARPAGSRRQGALWLRERAAAARPRRPRAGGGRAGARALPRAPGRVFLAFGWMLDALSLVQIYVLKRYLISLTISVIIAYNYYLYTPVYFCCSFLSLTQRYIVKFS